MKIIEIKKLENGAHNNQDAPLRKVPNGWAKIPDGLICENFPFGDIEAEEINGIMTVTSWTPGTIPEVPEIEAEPTEEEDLTALAVDHEYRLALLELGITE